MSTHLDLLNYRRRVHQIYAQVRVGQGEEAWEEWVQARNELFATHPQSPIEDRTKFSGLKYFDYDPKWRVNGIVRTAPGMELDVRNSGVGMTRFVNFGTVRFTLAGKRRSLSLLWLVGYGDGLFLPFRDDTSGNSTYGGGRYLIDTAKGADLGHDGQTVVLDFNYAYHPSCFHSDVWSCPLAPASNVLDLAVTAGERAS